MKILAPAKLNLFLEVTGKRPNGYHELYSLCAFLNLADELEIELVNGASCIVHGVNIDNNIVLTAANLLKKNFSVAQGCKITLTKNIPMGGGLGGGSADAAATLIALSELWGLNLSHDELYKIGLELGADVPVCLYSQLNNTNAAIFEGIGEILSPAPKLPPLYFALVNPNIHLATKEVFQKLTIPKSITHKEFQFSLNELKNRTNHLEPVSKALCPEISIILETLLHQNGCILSRMTGSGSTCFGIFENKADAELATKKILAAHPKWFVKTAELI